MKRSKFTEEQIAFVLRQVESGTTVAEVCRKMGVSEATFIQLEEEIRWPGRQRATTSGAIGRRKRPAQANGRGSEHG